MTELDSNATRGLQDDDGRPAWGVPEALLGWVGGSFAAVVVFTIFRSLGFSLFTPEGPGGFFGRAVGQNQVGDGFADDALPLFLQMFAQVPGWIVMLAITWVVAGALGHKRVGLSFAGEPLDVARGFVMGFILQIPVVIILVNLVVLIFDASLDTRAQSLVDSINGPIDLIALFLGVVVGAPIVEEIFYRGILQRALVDRFGTAIGIGVASLLFGAVHFSWVNLIPLSVVGAGFGFLFHKYGRLLPAIIAHMTFNFIALVFALSA